MQYKGFFKYTVGVGFLILMGLILRYDMASAAIMAEETELAGLSYTLNQYCNSQEDTGSENPENIVALQVSDNTDGVAATQEEIDSIEDGIVNQDGQTNPVEQTGQETKAKPTATPKPVSEYNDIGISIAESYVHVRKKPNTKSKILGKLYRGSAAKITKRVGNWVEIKSGSVTGYIKSEFLAIGFSAEKLIDDFGTKWARVTTETLNVREEKNTTCTILTLVPEGESFEVIREDKEWAKILVDGTTKGYVAKEFIKISVRFKKAVSIEEELAEARRKAAAEAAAREAAAQAASSSSSSSSGSSGSSSSSSRSSGSSSSSSRSSGGSSSSSRSSGSSSSSGRSSSGGGSSSRGTKISSGSSGGSAVGSGNGSDIASYALNFVGNPYHWGGTSLTNGADCSGFVQSVFRKFGISLPRTSGSQSGVGAKISVGSARAGDLIFYASGGRVNHVALCIGGGRVVHASNPSTGITTSNLYYRTPYCARRIVN